MPMKTLDLFDPMRPIEESRTPPFDWYTDEDFAKSERHEVFERAWIAVGRKDQLKRPGDFFTGEITENPYVVAMNEDGEIKAHHNVCRHKGAIVAQGEGHITPDSCMTCPYHGWQYNLDGKITKMPNMGKVNFNEQRWSLQPIEVDTWGPFVFVDMDGPFGGANNPRSLLTDFEHIQPWLDELGMDGMRFFERREYVMNCNWKVFVDNSLDGGYHVKYAHEGLASGLEEDTFKTHVYDRSVVQVCETNSSDERLGGKVVYAWLFPNLFINRYGNMMDTNVVLPLGANKCKVIFDFYFSFPNFEDYQTQKQMRRSVDSSHAVQLEDVTICESAQRGMNSMSFKYGRYSSKLEIGVHHFHKILWREMRGFNDV